MEELESQNDLNPSENKITTLLKNIISLIELFIKNNIESPILIENTLNYIYSHIENIINGNFYFTKSEYSNIINDLEEKLKEYIIKETKYREEISNLQFELITTQRIIEKNKPIKQEQYESIIKKLKIKFQNEKDTYKLNEIKYIDKVEELTKINRDLNEQIKELELDKKDKEQILNNTIKVEYRTNYNCYRNLSKKGKSYNNIFKRRIKNCSTHNDENSVSKGKDFSYYNQSSKFLEFQKKNSIDGKFRLYKYYQKNKNTDLQKKFFINQNQDKLNYIINNNNKNIKNLLPRNPFDRKEKHYYSAFLKY